MTEDLKPCPFCGGEARRGYNGPTKEQVQHAIGWGEDLDDGGSFIECMTCQASTALHYDRCENLVDAWNRRAAKAEESGNQPRSERQRQVAEWCAAAFGVEHQASVPQRAVRFLEEAIEAYQAATHGALGSLEAEAMAHNLLTYVFSRPVGELRQELGGVGLTVLALAAAAGVDADASEVAEIQRVTSKPLEHFHARNAVKNAAGFDVTGAAYPTGTPAEARGSQPVAWSLVFSEVLGINAETTFKTREKAEAYAARCSSPQPRVVPLCALPAPPKAEGADHG